MVDLFFLLSFIAFFKIGYERGVIAEISDIVALLIAIILVFNLTEPITNILISLIKVENKPFLSMAVGFFIFFVSIFITLAIGYGLELYSKTNETINSTNKLIGGLLSMIKIFLLWWAIFLIITIFPSKGYFKEYIMDSFSYKIVTHLNPYIINVFKYVFPENINLKIKKIIK